MLNISLDKRMRVHILSSVILMVGIIHLGVGIGIVAKYKKYNDIYGQQVSLSGYNIFLGLVTIAVSILGFVSVLNGYQLLSKITALLAFILGIFAFASLIAALALSGQAANHLQRTITNYMSNSIQDQDAIDTINTLQSAYQCCGANLWLDWARYPFSISGGRVIGRRRRQHSSLPVSPLTRALRSKRQASTGNNAYNLPSSFTVNLPASCCQSGGTTSGNTNNGICGFNINNTSNNFYVGGCLGPVSNNALSQITGIAVINTCLTILVFVYCVKLLTLFPNNTDSNNKQPNQNTIYEGQQQQQQPYPYQQYDGYNNNPNQNGINQVQQQQQQYPYQPSYGNNNRPNPYYTTYNDLTYKSYL